MSRNLGLIAKLTALAFCLGSCCNSPDCTEALLKTNIEYVIVNNTGLTFTITLRRYNGSRTQEDEIVSRRDSMIVEKVYEGSSFQSPNVPGADSVFFAFPDGKKLGYSRARPYAYGVRVGRDNILSRSASAQDTFYQSIPGGTRVRRILSDSLYLLAK
jgi:hypothetical protein